MRIRKVELILESIDEIERRINEKLKNKGESVCDIEIQKIDILEEKGVILLATLIYE